MPAAIFTRHRFTQGAPALAQHVISRAARGEAAMAATSYYFATAAFLYLLCAFPCRRNDEGARTEALHMPKTLDDARKTYATIVIAMTTLRATEERALAPCRAKERLYWPHTCHYHLLVYSYRHAKPRHIL